MAVCVLIGCILSLQLEKQCTQMQIDFLCGLCSNYHHWDMYLSQWIRFSNLDYTALSFQKALLCPLHIGESFIVSRNHQLPRGQAASRESRLCRVRLLKGNMGKKRLEGAGSTQATWHSVWRNGTCQKVSAARLVGFASAYAAVCRVPELTAWKQSNSHTNFITLDSCPSSPSLYFHGSLCSKPKHSSFLDHHWQHLELLWLEVLAFRIIRLWR